MARTSQNPRLQRLTEGLCLRLRRRQILGSRAVARETISLLITAVDIWTEESSWADFETLLASVESLGRLLEDSGPKELVIGNIVRRVLKFLKEEYNTALQGILQPTISGGPSNVQTPGPIGYQGEAPDFFAHASSALRRQQSLSSGSTSASPTRGSSTSSPPPISSQQPHAPTIFDLLGHRGPIASTAQEEHPLSTSISAFTTPSISPAISRVSSSAYLKGLTKLSGPGEVSAEEEFSKRAFRLKRLFTEAITELLDEVESVHTEIAQQAMEHVNSSDLILTLGYSRTVESFLKAAALKRKITVFVAETAPSLRGRTLALSLSSAGIETILIPDSSVFALMSRVTKVVLGTHAVLADGSLLSISGSLPICRAAKAHLVPVMVCTGMYKVCPLFLGDDVSLLDEGSPEEVGDVVGDVRNPYFDRVPGDLISLLITNNGGYPASMAYRLLIDLYGA